ncbi:hypothetical protein SDC9_144378 [bioreactor metagenome]|uniref:Uncharacterized protein n=1 Tax=bioreactor metagenome TaxID=1076179 RepID=A0A645E6T3_9ZZZZ
MESGRVKPALAKEAKQILEQTKSNIIGIILNKMEVGTLAGTLGYYHLDVKDYNASDQELVQEEAK